MANLPAVAENLEQRELFEEYLAMGTGRSLKKLMPHTNRAWKTVQAWSIKFNWVERVRAREKELMENLDIETPREIKIGVN